MRIGKRVLLILGAIVLVAALVSLYMVYSRQTGERNDLNARLSRAQTLLPGLTATKTDLENQLASAQSSLDASRAKFPEAVDSIEYGEEFFRVAYGENLYSMAAGCGVELTSLTFSPPGATTVGPVTYAVSSLTVVVSGEIGNVLKFIDAIGTGLDYELPWSLKVPWSVEVKSVSVNVGGSTTITLDVYGYKGK
jgi:hypothetical protein